MGTFTWPWSLFERVRPAMALATGLTHRGDETCGSAFHIGAGVFVTAAHVASLSHFALRPEEDEQPVEIRSIFYAPNDADIAVVTTDFDGQGFLHIGTNWDDIGPEGLIGAPVVLLGYPPIPKADRAVLVLSPGHLCAIIDRYDGVPNAHYITSTMSRGGFSGGPVVAAMDEEQPWVMAVHVESLTRDDQAPETGFGAAVSIDPVWITLEQNQLRPPGMVLEDEAL